LMHHIPNQFISRISSFVVRYGLHFLEGDNMERSQTERLQQDVKELEHYALKLRKKGKHELMEKILIKKEFLASHINGENTMRFAS